MDGIFTLKGKNIILTGACGFFGKVFSRGLLEAGADKIVVIDINAEKLNLLAQELAGEFGEGRVIAYELDQNDIEQAEKLYATICRALRIDGLVNNAFNFSEATGFNTAAGKLEHCTYDQLKASFDSGIYWAIQTTKAFGFHMKENESGAIVNVCSFYAVVVPNKNLYKNTEKFNPPGYSMAKAGLLQFTRYAASFLSPHVRVNAISPGAIPNIGNDSYNAITIDDPVLRKLRDNIPLERLGKPQDLTGAVVFLLSEASSYMTGQNVIIDGGITIT